MCKSLLARNAEPAVFTVGSMTVSHKFFLNRGKGGAILDYIKSFIQKHRYGPWKGILVGYLVLCAAAGVSSAWGSHHFLSSFALWTVTHALYVPVIFSILGFAAWAGISTGNISKSSVLGLIVGIAAFCVYSVAILNFAGEIPGIGWRFMRIINSSGSDL